MSERASSAARVDHQPIVVHFARRLGLVEMINRLVTTEMEVEPGVIALSLVLDTLNGRSPLYCGGFRAGYDGFLHTSLLLSAAHGQV